jgi:hypothetical protein
VPGTGKPLAGLNLASSWHNENDSEHAVFLSGNGPLVDVLREALARDGVKSVRENGVKKKRNNTISKAKAFIKNIHHFRDDALENTKAPVERVVIFDEAQRAWTLKQTASFPMCMTRDIDYAKSWLRSVARRSECYGLLASSGASRLMPFSINVQNSINPVI